MDGAILADFASNVQVRRRLPAGQMCRSEPGGATYFFPSLAPSGKASGVPGKCIGTSRLRLTVCYAMWRIFANYELFLPKNPIIPAIANIGPEK